VIETATFRSMGCDVVVGGASARELRGIQELFDARDATFSRFRLDSELNRINAAAGRVVRVSCELARALTVALETAERTDGLVDPTLGVAIEDAGYRKDFAALEPEPAPPGPGATGAWESVRLSGRLLHVPPRVRLDLNGVVKSLTVDDALELVSGPGLVSAGGDLAASTEVDVGLSGGDAIRVVEGGLATSGTSSRRWLRGGTVQHHLIDPHSGRPADSPWDEVTASGASCLDADVAAKAAFLLGDDGPAWLDEHGIAGRFLAGGRAFGNETWRAALQGAACST
jgi:FAD:protein FMN transferase